jgi:hypothetical protein
MSQSRLWVSELIAVPWLASLQRAKKMSIRTLWALNGRLPPSRSAGWHSLVTGQFLSDPAFERVPMFIHAKKLSLTAVLALLGSALVASPAQAALAPVVVDCVGGSFTYTRTVVPISDTFPGGLKAEVASSLGCTGTITIPMQVNSIAPYAFKDSPALDSVVFADFTSIQYIAPFAFWMHPSLTSITIPAGVNAISVAAFGNSPLLTSVTFEGHAPTVEPYFMLPDWLAFQGTNVLSVANIGAVATGFGEGSTWEGLTIVRADPAPAAAEAPTPYSGALPGKYSDRTPEIGEQVTISGQRLDQVTSCTIDGLEVEMSSQSATGLTIVIPVGLGPGLKDLVMVGAFGKLTAQGAFTVEASPAKSPVVAEKTNAGSFNGYVAVYAKGHKGKTLSWKIAGKWFKTTITSDFQVFQRKTEAVGLDVEVHLYIDGEKQSTMTVKTS